MTIYRIECRNLEKPGVKWVRSVNGNPLSGAAWISRECAEAAAANVRPRFPKFSYRLVRHTGSDESEAVVIRVWPAINPVQPPAKPWAPCPARYEVQHRRGSRGWVRSELAHATHGHFTKEKATRILEELKGAFKPRSYRIKEIS